MKKFYAQIFIAAFLLTGFCSQAQVYNSINANPSNYTFDDPRFWIGGVRPPNPCTGCTININSNVILVNSGTIPSTATPTATSVFNAITPTPGTLNIGRDPVTPPTGPPFNQLTVGMRFQASVPGQITGVSFWQDPIMSGSHTVGLFANGGGAPLAQASATDGTGLGGWRTISFLTPVAITGGTTYVAAVYMDNTFYDWSIIGTTFATAPVVNGVLSGLQSNPPSGNANGVYSYGTTLTFPSSSFTLGTNYWVDPVFAATPYNLNTLTLNGSSLNVRGNTNVTINPYVQLNGSTLSVGNDPTSVETVFVNDQIDLDATSTVQLANATTIINANNDDGNTVLGPHVYFTGTDHIAGIYYTRGAVPGPPGAVDFTLTSILSANYNLTASIPIYQINCGAANPANTCAKGLVFGPALTQLMVVCLILSLDLHLQPLFRLYWPSLSRLKNPTVPSS